MAKTTSERLSNQIAIRQALKTRIAKINKKIAKETDPAKKAELQARLAKINERVTNVTTRIKGLKDTVNIEGVTGPANLAAAESAANKFKPELGRVFQYDKDGNPIRAAETTEALEGFKSIWQKGMEAPEYQAEREQRSQGLTSDYRTAQSELAKAQAKSKVFGAAGAAQQANLIRADKEKRDDLEQKLMLESTKLKNEYLDKYSSNLWGVQDYEMQGKKVDLGQSNAEEAARQTWLANMIGAGMGKDYQEKAFELSNKALDAAQTPLEFPDVGQGENEPENSGPKTGDRKTENGQEFIYMDGQWRPVYPTKTGGGGTQGAWGSGGGTTTGAGGAGSSSITNLAKNKARNNRNKKAGNRLTGAVA